MDRQKIQKLVEQLENEVSRDDAILRIHKNRNPYGNILIGNEKGLMRFGIHSLKSALQNNEDLANLELDFEEHELAYLQGDELEPFVFAKSEKVQKLTLEQSQQETKLELNKSTRIYIYLFVAFFCGLILIGSYTSINWLFKLIGITF